MPSRQFLIQQSCLTALAVFYPHLTPKYGARSIETGVLEHWWYAEPFVERVRREYRSLVQLHGAA